MKTEQELNEDILKLTLLIREGYPELAKYTTEMPVTIPYEKNPQIDLTSLQDYYDSLEVLLKEYSSTHKRLVK